MSSSVISDDSDVLVVGRDTISVAVEGFDEFEDEVGFGVGAGVN